MWCVLLAVLRICFCKQKTAYGWRISDWSSDVCSSDLESLKKSASCIDVAVLMCLAPDIDARNQSRPRREHLGPRADWLKDTNQVPCCSVNRQWRDRKSVV